MALVLLGEVCVAIRVLFASFPVGSYVWTCHGKIWYADKIVHLT
jgi:hypothetical protein